MFEVVIFSLIGGLFSLIGGIFLIRNNKSAKLLARYATPFAAGVLLAAAFTDLIPESLYDSSADSILRAVLFSILGFFLLERFLRVFHHHHDDEETSNKGRSSNSLIVIGDTLHNALDGVAIGAAFLIDTPTGIVAALAVAAHAIGSDDSSVIPYLLAITAGFFIYIALSDVIPEIHDTTKKGTRDIRPYLLLVGALMIMIISPLAHDYIDAGHSDHEHSEMHDDDHGSDDLDEDHSEIHKEVDGEKQEHAEDHSDEHHEE
jgi:zinc and cadmium transporter